MLSRIEEFELQPMPDPSSLIHQPAAAHGVAAAAFQPGVTEAEFRTRFPRPFKVRAIDLHEARTLGYPTDRTYWNYLEPFEYVSPKWGSILIPQGFPTDFASVPPQLHSFYDDDSPILLYPSAPHDFLFTKRATDGTRGWLANGKQLTLHQVNEVLTEAMQICGANAWARSQVFLAVELANHGIRNEIAHTPATP
jgi:hypothetical protein